MAVTVDWMTEEKLFDATTLVDGDERQLCGNRI
jgi:hypothetical protein